jgi:hypothetical protein
LEEWIFLKNPTAVYKKLTSPHWQDTQRLKGKETNITSKWSVKTSWSSYIQPDKANFKPKS